MTRSDLELLTEALEHFRAIDRHLSRGDMDDDTIVDAVSLRLAAAIDAAGRVSAAHRAVIFGEEWPLASATRNRIVHGYAFVDRRIIQNTVRSDLPSIQSAIELLVSQLAETHRDGNPQHSD